MKKWLFRFQLSALCAVSAAYGIHGNEAVFIGCVVAILITMTDTPR